MSMKSLFAIREGSCILTAIVKWQNSSVYLLSLTLLCAISGLCNGFIYIPGIGIYCACIVIAALFNHDLKALIPPILLVYYAIGFDNDLMQFYTTGDVFGAFGIIGKIALAVYASIAAISVIVRFVLDGGFLVLKEKKGFLIGMLAINIALVLGGAFSRFWVAENLFFGVASGVGLIFFYAVAKLVFSKIERAIEYLCRSMVYTSCAVAVQVLVLIVRAQIDGKFIHYSTNFGRFLLQRMNINLAWGNPTIIAVVLVLGIGAAMFLAREHKRPLPFMLLSILYLLCALLLGTRSAMLVGAVAFLFCLAVLSFSGSNRKKVRIFALSLCGIGVMGVIAVHFFIKPLPELLPELAVIFRFDNLLEDRRFRLWKNGINDFLSAPVFGTGVCEGSGSVSEAFKNIYSNMYHNILIQFMGSMGVVGCVAVTVHLLQVAVAFFRNYSVKKALLLVLPITILALSLFDNFFFYMNFQILYTFFLAAAENAQCRSIGESYEHKT